MARLVLVHGAFVGGWSWEPVIEPLEAKGHTVEAFDLPGSAGDPTPVPDVTLDAYADKICSVLAERPEPAVLVGWSMGGVAVTEASARCPDRLAAVIYVAAFLPADGESLLSLTQLPEGADDQVQANMVVDEEAGVSTMPAGPSRSALYGDCSEEQAAWGIERMKPQALAPMATPVSIPEGALDGIPRHYVICNKDQAIPAALQRRMSSERGCDRVLQIDTDHTPMLSATDELVDAIDQLAAYTRVVA